MEIAKKPLVKRFEQYYDCPNPNCDSVYHVSNFNVSKFTCRDCKEESEIPKEAREKAKFYK